MATLAVRPESPAWQVSEAASRLIGETPEYDLWYLEHRNWRLDGWILWQTVRRMLPGTDPIALADVPAWCVPGAMTPAVA